MIYLGNGLYSESGPGVLAHGGPWKTHKYIAIKNGRYIYPGDVKGGNRDKYQSGVNSQGPSAAERAQRAQSNSSGEDVSRNVSGMPKYGRPDNKKYQIRVSTQAPSVAEQAQRQRNYDSYASKNTSSGSNSVKYKKTKDINKNRKYQKAVSSQGPSAAERAQTTRYYSSKINGKWDTPPEAESNNIHGTTRQRMVSYNNKPKGPSAAEMAQRGANGNSRNTDSKTKKKKKLFWR